MNRRAIPVYGLGVYEPTAWNEQGVFVGTLAEAIARRRHWAHPHAHPFFQLFLFSGSGGFMRDFAEYAISGPALAFVSPGEVHMVRVRPGLRASVVSFTPEFFDAAAPPPSRLLGLPFFFSPDRSPLLRVPPGEAARFRSLFGEMGREFGAALPGAADILRSCLQLVFSHAARLDARSRPKAAAAASRPARLVRAFRLAVEECFRETVSLPRYAALLRVTPNHLNDTVRAETGESAGTLLRRRRLLEAKRLLLHSDLSVSEIGYRLGFGDASYFSRFFRRDGGAPPLAFRERIREKYPE